MGEIELGRRVAEYATDQHGAHNDDAHNLPVNSLPPRVLPIRKALETALTMHPDAFDRKMNLSDLKRLMDSLGVRFNIGECAGIAKQSLGSSNPSDTLRKYCADLVILGGKPRNGPCNKLHACAKASDGTSYSDGDMMESGEPRRSRRSIGGERRKGRQKGAPVS